jgi:long-chain acyl-CoA synthetase
MSDFDNLNSLDDFYRTRCERYHDRILFNNIITYGEAYDYARARAAFLQKQGFRKGDIIGLLAFNGPEWCVTYMAITMLGAIALPLDNNLPPVRHSSMMKEAGCRAIFVSDEYAASLKRVRKFSVDLESSMDFKKKFRAPTVNPDECASMVFTSGTTGASKIVMLSHRNVYSIAIGCSHFMDFAPGDVNLCLLPLFHVYALCANFTGPFAYGGSLVFLQSLKGPDIMKALAENPITVFPAAPQLWELFMDGIINRVKAQSKLKYRIFMFFVKAAPVLKLIGLGFLLKRIFSPVHDIFGPSHRAFISGGAAMKSKYIRYYRNMGFTLIEGYGLTETTGPITLDDYKKVNPGSVGKVTKGNELKIRNINSDGVGEIWLRGDGVMLGYYKNEKANKEAFDEDGFFNTGDLGRLGPGRKLYITGRSRNVIVLSSGKNVYPEELESYYRQSDEISSIAVFGRKVDGSETVYAVIVPASHGGDAYRKVRDEIRRLSAGLPVYKTIHRFALSPDPLPVNTTRKIIYREVAANLEKGLYQENEEDSAVLKTELVAQDPGDEAVISFLKKKFRQRKLLANQMLRDFNVDSLGLVELATGLEHHLGVSIDMKELQKKETLDELLQYMRALERTQGSGIDAMIFEGEIVKKPVKIVNPLHYIVLTFMKILSRIFWGVKVHDRKRLTVNNKIIIANHQSYLDIIWIACAVPASRRSQIYVTGKRKMFFLQILFPMIPVIWIGDDNALEVLKASADLLRQGKSLVIFPEGTRTPDGEMRPFKTGAAYLARGLGKSVIPITVNGAFDIWPRDRKLPAFFSGKKGSLTVGNIIHPVDYDSVEELNMAMEQAVRENLHKGE